MGRTRNLEDLKVNESYAVRIEGYGVELYLTQEDWKKLEMWKKQNPEYLENFQIVHLS